MLLAGFETLRACKSSAKVARVSSPTCQVRVDGDMVRIFPTLEAAEPVSDELPASSLLAACCEWRVRSSMKLYSPSSCIKMSYIIGYYRI